MRRANHKFSSELIVHAPLRVWTTGGLLYVDVLLFASYLALPAGTPASIYVVVGQLVSAPCVFGYVCVEGTIEYVEVKSRRALIVLGLDNVLNHLLLSRRLAASKQSKDRRKPSTPGSKQLLNQPIYT